MKNKICCFAGHSEIYDNEIKQKISKAASYLIETKGVNSFLVGNYGQFDNYALESLAKLKETYQNIEINIVIPYLTNNTYNLKKCDNVVIANIPENTPRRLQIIKANEYMVNKSEYLICYVKYSWGGASMTYNYAKSKKKTIYNLAEQS